MTNEDIKEIISKINDKKISILDLNEDARNNSKIVLAAIKNDASMIKYVGKKLDNLEFYKKAVNVNGKAYEFLPKFKDNNEVIFSALKNNFEIANLISSDLLDNELFVYQALVVHNLNIYRYLSNRLKNNIDIAKKSIALDVNNAKYLSDKLKNNLDIVDFIGFEYAFYDLDEGIKYLNKEMVIYLMENKNYGSKIYKNIDPALKEDKEIAYLALIKDYRNFSYLSDNLKEDKELVLFAMEESKKDKFYQLNIFSLLSDKMKADTDIIKECLEIGSKYYRLPDDYFPVKFDDKDFILECLKINHNAISLASEELLHDKDFVIEAIKCNSECYGILPPYLHDVLDVAKVAIERNTRNFNFVSDRLKDDKDLVLFTVERNGSLLEEASGRLRNDEDVVVSALLQSGEIRYANPRFFARKDLFLRAIRESNGYYLPYLLSWGTLAVRNDRTIITEFAKRFPNSFEFANVTDKEFISGLVNEVPQIIKFIDIDMAVNAISNNPSLIDYASENLKDIEFIIKVVHATKNTTIIKEPLLYKNLQGIFNEYIKDLDNEEKYYEALIKIYKTKYNNFIDFYNSSKPHRSKKVIEYEQKMNDAIAKLVEIRKG